MEINKIIGQRINSLLAYKHINQKDLAKELGVKDNVISYWCNGTRKPNFEQIIRMSQFFNVSTDYLLGVTSAPTNDKDVQFICDYTGLTERTVKILNNMKNRDFKQPITINEQGYNTFFDYKDWIFYLRNIEKIIRYSPTLNAFSDLRQSLYDYYQEKENDKNSAEFFSELPIYEEKIDISLYKIQKSMMKVIEIYSAGLFENKIYEEMKKERQDSIDSRGVIFDDE